MNKGGQTKERRQGARSQRSEDKIADCGFRIADFKKSRRQRTEDGRQRSVMPDAERRRHGDTARKARKVGKARKDSQVMGYWSWVMGMTYNQCPITYHRRSYDFSGFYDSTI